MRYTVILEDGREYWLRGHPPGVAGVRLPGPHEACGLKNIREAMEAYIEALIEDGLPVPTERGRQTVEVEVAVR